MELLPLASLLTTSPQLHLPGRIQQVPCIRIL
jgi:hypothetical protein